MIEDVIGNLTPPVFCNATCQPIPCTMPSDRLRKLTKRATIETPRANALRDRYRAALTECLEGLFGTLRVLRETKQIYNRSCFGRTRTIIHAEELAYFSEWHHDLDAEQHLVYSRETTWRLFGRNEHSRFSRDKADDGPKYTFRLVSRWWSGPLGPSGKDVDFISFLAGVVDEVLVGKIHTGAKGDYLGTLDHLTRALDLVDAYRRRVERNAVTEEDRLAALERRST